MSVQIDSVPQTEVLNEIIDRAMELPVEKQDLLLMMAKAMRYTRKSIMRQGKAKQPRKSLKS